MVNVESVFHFWTTKFLFNISCSIEYWRITLVPDAILWYVVDTVQGIKTFLLPMKRTRLHTHTQKHICTLQYYFSTIAFHSVFSHLCTVFRSVKLKLPSRLHSYPTATRKPLYFARTSRTWSMKSEMEELSFVREYHFFTSSFPLLGSFLSTPRERINQDIWDFSAASFSFCYFYDELSE